MATSRGDGGSNAAVVAIFVIALVVIAIVIYGFAVGHWFGGGGTVNVVTSPGAPSVSPSK